MKTEKLRKRLEKEYQENSGMVDGYVRFDEVSIIFADDREKYIQIKGAYGYPRVDGTWYQQDLTLYYKNGKSAEYVAGMFAQYVYDKETKE